MREEIIKILDSPNKKVYEGEHGKLIAHGNLNVNLIARYLLGMKQEV